MTVCVLTVVFDRCGVIARRRSRAVLRRGSMKSESLAIGVAGTKCETLTMPSECRSRDVDNEHSPAIVEIVGGDIVAESAVDEIEAEDRIIGVVEASTDSGTVSPISTSGVVCPWHFGCRGPSPSPSGISVEWVVRFRH